MSYDGCFAECMKPTVKGDFKVLDQHSSWSSAQVPSQFSCRTTNLSFHQIGGGLTASRDSEAHSERIFSEDSEHGISLLPGGCRESFGEYGNFALTEGRFPLHRFEDETDTITQGEGTNEGRELGCNLPPSVSHFWPPFPPQTQRALSLLKQPRRPKEQTIPNLFIIQEYDQSVYLEVAPRRY
ncbi:hypothetical protein TcCL_ESM08951 [Trypanosoma cruzi]|nr:hypothetical protein TcCL_ESM08951 [Trypanosoma cruzi]